MTFDAPLLITPSSGISLYTYNHSSHFIEAYGGTDLDDDVKRLDLEESSYDSSYPVLSPAEQDLIDSVNSSQNMSASEEFTQLNSKIENEMTTYETKDLLVKVDKPEKVVRAMESFVQYTVSTKVSVSNIKMYCFGS